MRPDDPAIATTWCDESPPLYALYRVTLQTASRNETIIFDEDASDPFEAVEGAWLRAVRSGPQWMFGSIKHVELLYGYAHDPRSMLNDFYPANLGGA